MILAVAPSKRSKNFCSLGKKDSLTIIVLLTKIVSYKNARQRRRRSIETEKIEMQKWLKEL